MGSFEIKKKIEALRDGGHDEFLMGSFHCQRLKFFDGFFEMQNKFEDGGDDGMKKKMIVVLDL